MPVPDTWQKSSYSGGGDGNACVEVADRRTHIAIRDSKAPARATLTFPATAFAPFLAALKQTVDAELQIHSVERQSPGAATCIVRCVGGVARAGQRFGVGAGGGTGGDAPTMALEEILLYERPVDFVDPPHSAKVQLAGEAVRMLGPGRIITSVGAGAQPL